MDMMSPWETIGFAIYIIMTLGFFGWVAYLKISR